MNKIDKLAATLKSAGESKKTSAYDTSAKVIRVDGNTAYVNIPGGVAETPASMVVNAKAGEEVRVHVAGGKAYVTGNATSPPTDDSLAQRAENNAIRAQNAAENATRDAKTAKTSADSAVKDAATAKKSADDAVEDAARAHEAADSAQASAIAANTAAQEAKADAQTANQAATNALRELSTVEDVVDVLTWITEHGIMTSQAGGTFVDGQVYFIVDPNGDYEVGGTRYSVVQNPVASDIDNYYVLSVDEAVTNYVATHIAVDAEGLWIIPDTNNGNRVLIATGAGTQYATAGTYIIGTGGVVNAKFTKEEAVIGEPDKTRVEINSRSLKLLDAEGIPFFHVSDLREYHTESDKYGEGFYYIATDTYVGDGVNRGFELSYHPRDTYDATVTLDGVEVTSGYRLTVEYIIFDSIVPSGTAIEVEYPVDSTTVKGYTVGLRESASKIAPMSYAEGYHTAATGDYSHSEGRMSMAMGVSAHAEGYLGRASKDCSHAEGYATTAGGIYSHAEGNHSIANGDASHAEGNTSIASGMESHAEGSYTTASGTWAHAEGKSTVASGDYSHAQGRATKAEYNYQTAIGKFNNNKSANLFEIGNGTADNARSNAFEVTDTGNMELALDTSAGSSTVDGQLYAAITALGWQSTVID